MPRMPSPFFEVSKMMVPLTYWLLMIVTLSDPDKEKPAGGEVISRG